MKSNLKEQAMGARKRSTAMLGTCAVIGLVAAAFTGGLARDAGAVDATPIYPAAGAITALTDPTRGTAERLPQSIVALALDERPAGVNDSLYEGAWRTEEAELLLSDVGSSDIRIHAVPTSKGKACLALTLSPSDPTMPDGAGGCIGAFNARSPVALTVFDPDAVSDGDPVVVGGLAPTGVTGVAIVVDGVSHPALLENNAFAYELESNSSYPEAAVVTYANGARSTMTIPDPRKAMLAAGGG
jgi:hypothetical protein